MEVKKKTWWRSPRVLSRHSSLNIIRCPRARQYKLKTNAGFVVRRPVSLRRHFSDRTIKAYTTETRAQAPTTDATNRPRVSTYKEFGNE